MEAYVDFPYFIIVYFSVYFSDSLHPGAFATQPRLLSLNQVVQLCEKKKKRKKLGNEGL